MVGWVGGEPVASADEDAAVVAEALGGGGVEGGREVEPEVPGAGRAGRGGRAEDRAGGGVAAGALFALGGHEGVDGTVGEEGERGDVVDQRGAGGGVF